MAEYIIQMQFKVQARTQVDAIRLICKGHKREDINETIHIKTTEVEEP